MISRPSRPTVFGAMSLTLLLGCSVSRSDNDVREQEYEGGQLITAEEIRQSSWIRSICRSRSRVRPSRTSRAVVG